MTSAPVFCAIDTVDVSRARSIVSAVAGVVAGIKIGLEFFHANGTRGVHVLRDICNSLLLFLDLKFHDIPTTVAGAVRGVMPLQPFMIDVHASGGRSMMKAAAATCAEEADKAGMRRPLVVGVTVLTSLDINSMAEVGMAASSVADQVMRLASLAQACGLDGVVCSAHEVRRLRAGCGPGFRLVVPGVRPVWADNNDQRRVLTPSEALAAGADLLVIGRPMTAASDPAAAARRIAREIVESQGHA